MIRLGQVTNFVLWNSLHHTFPYRISDDVETMVYLSQSRHEICDNCRPTVCPASIPNLIVIGQKV